MKKVVMGPEVSSETIYSTSDGHPVEPMPYAPAGTFEWALMQMKQGKRVTRQFSPNETANEFWIGAPHMCFFEDDLLNTTWRLAE